MKAIILAAGMGTRLGKYTQDIPKCMLPFQGKPLIEWQVQALREAGISDISIVKGYKPEKISIAGTKSYYNPLFSTTNMVETLFCAEEELTGDVLVCYADIIYEQRVLQKIKESKADVGVVVDEDYGDYWRSRMEHPEEDTESLVVENGNIVELGETTKDLAKAKVRYVGLLKFSPQGINTLKNIYHQQRRLFYDKDEPWMRSKSFRKAYMTCMIQAIINSGQAVEPIVIRRGWLEFDTVDDYERYTQWAGEGTLQRFITLDF